MIKPEEIRRKAENLYPHFLRAWLGGEAFFPRQIPCRKEVDDNLAAAAESIQQLRQQAKESRGFGYTIEWVERNSRTHGRNRFPRRIVFETERDFLQFLGRQRAFESFTAAVEHIRSKYAVLDGWIRSHRQVLVDSASDAEGLLGVVAYLAANPRPGIFARELPLSVDTKFVERNSRVLREWLDLILPPHSIRADEEHFERRYGLKYAEPLILIRFLDREMQRQVGSPWSECSVPLHSLANFPVVPPRVLIVENKVNLLTLPCLPGVLAIGGLGNSVTNLRWMPWLSQSEVWYWGDIDAEGLAILSRLRVVFPNARSLMMDVECLTAWRDRIGTAGSGGTGVAPSNLTETETLAFLICATDNLRIEQERFPQAIVLECLKKIIAAEG